MLQSEAVSRPGPFGRWLWRQGNRLHSFVYRRGIARKLGQMPLILLTTTGRKSGKPHTVPLGAIREGDGWVVIGSYGGADVHPSWWLNLVANPNATIQTNGETFKVHMHEITNPADYERIWNRVVATMSGYASYTKKTTRKIPLGLLRPV